MRVDYLRLRMRLPMPYYTEVAEPKPNMPASSYLQRKLCTITKSSYQVAFQGRGTFGRGGFSHLPFDDIRSEEPLSQMKKKVQLCEVQR